MIDRLKYSLGARYDAKEMRVYFDLMGWSLTDRYIELYERYWLGCESAASIAKAWSTKQSTVRKQIEVLRRKRVNHL